MTEETAGPAPATGEPVPEPGDGVQARDKWANKTEFLFAMAGEIIGLGNVWRFPYLCFKNGGGVFLIPYFAFLFFCGIPLFFMETALGQYTSEGGVTAWRKICPMFEGVGYASQVIVLYLNIYYIVVLAWTLFYLFNSFTYPLPWSTCDNFWNTDMCHNRLSTFANPHMFHPNSSWAFLMNSSSPGDYVDFDSEVVQNVSVYQVKSPEEEFWMHRVLKMSDDMSLAVIHWELAGCLLLAWVVCYFCIWKGVKSTGKVVYFTASFPYLMLVILFFRGVTLPGAGEGLMFYLMPDYTKVFEPQVWLDAGTQVFFSYALCQGVLTALGSYNKYNNDCYRDCIALCCLNSATSIFAGFAVFSVLGFMAHEMNVDISAIASSGPGLAFIAYPKALSLMPGSSFWAVLFFLMILFLGLDSQFVCVESLTTAITDLFPHHLRRPGRRELLVLGIAVVCFLLGLPFVSQGGIVLFQLMDYYGASGVNLLFIGCFETIVVAWVYGADRFYDNIQDMIGYQPFPVLKFCWLFVTPLLCGVTLVYDLSFSGPLLSIYDYVPGVWTSVFAGLLMFTPLVCIPVGILVRLWKDPGGMTRSAGDLRQVSPLQPPLSLCGRVVVRGQPRPPRTDGEQDKKPTDHTSAV